MTRGALDGIRVIDWTLYQQGPSGAMLLAEMGADVIHVEQRGLGDPMRGVQQIYGAALILPSGRQAFFEDCNKNKRSISLDLGTDKGRQILYALVAKSDVFLTNYRLRAVRKLGMDYQTLVAHRPNLIYGQATAFGERGPEQDSPGLELMACARSGAMLGSGEVGQEPVPLVVGAGDRIGGIFLAMGAITALLVRERTGEGQYFATSQLGGMVNLSAPSAMIASLTGQNVRANPRSRARNPLYNYYRCLDARWIALGMLESNTYWPTFCRGIGRPELEHDPRFANSDLRTENCEHLTAILDQAFASATCEQWEARFREAGDLLFTRVNNFSDLCTDPQILANEYLVDFDHPVLGAIKQVGLPLRFAKTPTGIHSPAPEYGQHTEEILLDDLGLAWEEVEALREEAII